MNKQADRLTSIDDSTISVVKFLYMEVEKKQQILKKIFIIIASIALCGLVYVFRFDAVVAMANDDGWYVLLAKALATGQGYTLINSPMPGILPLYPPAYPALLSFLWRLSPHFPTNIWLLKSLSISAMFGTGLMAYYYFRRIRNVSAQNSLFISLLTTLSPAFVFFATSTLMSECLFTFVQLLTIIALEKAIQSAKRCWLFLSLAVCGAAIAFLTRSFAIALIAAAILYLLKEKRYRLIPIFAIGVAVLIGPWIIYSRSHAPTPEQKTAQGGYIIYPYDEQFWMKRAGDAASGTETLADLPARVGANIVNIICRDMIGIVLPSGLRGAGESGSEGLGLGHSSSLGGGVGIALSTMIISTIISAIALLGFICQVRRRITLTEIVMPLSLGVIVLWPWWTFRFVLPLMPFLLYYFIVGLHAIGTQIGNSVSNVNLVITMPRIVLLCIIGLYGYDHLGYISLKIQNPKSPTLQWIHEFEESQELLAWVNKNTPADTAIVTTKPPMVYLFTGHKTISSGFVNERWDVWEKQGARYLVSLASHGTIESDIRLNKCPVVYKSPSEMCVIDLRPSSFDQAALAH